MAIKSRRKYKMTEEEIRHNENLLDEIQKKESRGELIGSVSDDFYFSPLDHFKRGICKEIAAMKVRKELSLEAVSGILEINNENARLILNSRVEKISTDDLIYCLLKLKNIDKEMNCKIDKLLNLFS